MQIRYLLHFLPSQNVIFVDRQIRNTLTGNLRAVEHGSDHGVSYVASTLHWGPDASHNAYYLTHKGKYDIPKFRLKIMPSSIVSILFREIYAFKQSGKLCLLCLF